jgi:hypothetical protein
MMHLQSILKYLLHLVIAITNDKNGVAKVFIAIHKESLTIAGYYTSSASVISTQAIRDELEGNFPRINTCVVDWKNCCKPISTRSGDREKAIETLF